MENKKEKFDDLIAEFKKLQPFTARETNIFNIGTKGYYENPTTDILAFFLDSHEQHQLGNIALRALLLCLDEEYHQLDPTLTAPPEREVSTKGGRIDLLLVSNDWVMVLENKIFHNQNNPFDSYQEFIQLDEKNRFAGKKEVFVVLSPDGIAPAAPWQGVSYTKLISNLKSLLSEHFYSQPLNKWTILLREFILHLEDLMTPPTVNHETRKFVLENLKSISELQSVKQQAIKEYHQELQVKLQQMLGKSVAIRQHTWGDYPALRFSLSCWNHNESDVVLFLSGDKEKTTIGTYAHLPANEDTELADSIILKEENVDRWLEAKNKYRCYRVYAADFNEERRLHFIADRLKELDQFEQAKQTSR
ncbi:PDDEXK-like family protein [Alkalimonas mucilaginosa]|uniref:PD-(D/E)XK nuclease family protein n=1 Tax=Alkalimonas mucilaginosa TaxID=3057676 RepID=A0ABU7JGS2_9GAMM|nr:PD-(D/E)XK nuclease family protein [Alkalimonas sp. MEB004]MEE2024882.1 PD-(D/E)XK nuclease family protein [Alkalimonas sp. MEB004]